MTPTKGFRIDLQKEANDRLHELYDRYFAAISGDSKLNEKTKIVSFSAFFNQIFISGLCSYERVLSAFEKRQQRRG